MPQRHRATAALLGSTLALATFIAPARAAHVPGVSVDPAATGLTAAALQPADAATAERAAEWIRDLSPGWIPNRGQFADGDGRSARDVLYSLEIAGGRVLVTERGVTTYFTARRHEAGPRKRKAAGGRAERMLDWARLDVVLEGADIRVERATADHPRADQGTNHYYAPHSPDGVLDVPAYGRVTFRDVYPGIDWVLVSEPGRPVHQDFIVRPGGDPRRIRLRYRGADGIELAPDSRSLTVRTALGEMREGPLVCFQDGPADTVGARFRLQRDLLSVKVDRYDRSRPLTIDPPLLWSTLHGGSNYDGPKSIAVDNVRGYVYIVGYTASSNMPVVTPPPPDSAAAYMQGASPNAADAFIWKFSQLGTRIWSTYYAGNGDDSAIDCAVDSLGNLYVVGFTSSTDFPTQVLPGAYNEGSNRGGYDGFLLKFNAQGARQWATYYGGDGFDFATGVDVDSTGRVFVCGYGASTDLYVVNPPGGGAYFQPANAGMQDSFILRFGTLGALQWATYHGGTSSEQAHGIAVGSGTLYVLGETYSATGFPTVDPPGAGDYFQPALSGPQDAFLSRFTLAGQQTWSTYFGGGDFDLGIQPVVDSGGNVIICGTTLSTDLPVLDPGGPAYFQPAFGGVYDILLARFNPSGVMQWSTYLGGSGADEIWGEARGIAPDSQGGLYLTGVSISADFPLANPGGGAYYQNTLAGVGDVVFCRFAPGDSLEWSTFYGGNEADFGTGVAVGIGDCVFGTGEAMLGGSIPAVNPPGMNAWFQPVTEGSDDGFITRFCRKLSACCVELTCVPVASAAECGQLYGTAYFPNQTCANTSCNVLCTICGTKFSDVNRNGVQDPGEPGIPGWTVELRYPGGTVYASAVTGPAGEYCFDDVPCGPWLVTEAQQNGWVKTAPAGAGHALSLDIATTRNGVDFGNYACPTAPPCAQPPAGLAAWWPFDDGPGATAAMDVARAASARNAAVLHGGAVAGAGELCLGGATDYASVPSAAQRGLDFSNGSFAVSAWIRPVAGTAGDRVVVERRGPATSMGVQGWSLYLDGMQCMLLIGAGGTPQVVTGPALPAGAWSHVVVSVDRAGGEGRWYLDGDPVATGDFLPIAGSISSATDLVIGQSDPERGAGPGLQGCLAQLALFAAPLSANAARKAYGAGPGTGVPVAWCPDYALLPAVKTVCQNQGTAQVCFTIGNSSASPATYSWSLAGLPQGPGCTFAGPTQFSPASGTVVVPAGGQSQPICVTITRPNGFTAQGATSCFALTFVNHATGVCRTRTSALRVDYSCWCDTPVPSGLVQVPSAGKVVSFGVKLPCDPVTTLAYRVVARAPEGDYPDPRLVSLDHRPPGAPGTGVVQAGSGADGEVQVAVAYPGGFDPTTRYELVLEADADGDGTFEAIASAFVAAVEDSQATTDAPFPGGGARAPGLLPSPNPFTAGTTLAFALAQAEPVTLEVFDLGGRLVRPLVRGWLEPGARSVAWDGRDQGGRRVAPGVYLARLRTRAGSQEARLVKLR